MTQPSLDLTPELSLGALQLAVLLAAALVAGVVDAIAGGGGLVTVPALLWAGLPPQLALGTNKGQGVFGTFASLWRYGRAGMLDRERAKVSLPFGFAGALAGAALVLNLPPAVLRPVVLVLLVVVALFLAVRPPPQAKAGAAGAAPVRSPARNAAIAASIALAIGGYDGFFGPGTGTFLIIAYALAFAAPLARASADAKVVNFASNFASMLLFAWRGTVLWRLALPMAAAQFAGGWIGAHLAVKGGNGRVRWVVLGVVTALVIKLGLDSLRALG